MVFHPTDTHDAFLQSLQEKDPLLRAAAESLYEHEGNPFSNPEPVVNTVHWRKHPAVNPSHAGLGKIVDVMVKQEYAMRGSPYASQREFRPHLKLLGEEKIEFYKLLRSNLRQQQLPVVQELLLLDAYCDALKAQPNDLSPTRQAQLREAQAGLRQRGATIAAALGDALEHCNLLAFPTSSAQSRGRS